MREKERAFRKKSLWLLRKEDSTVSGRKGSREERTVTNMSTVFYLVSDDGIEVVDVHGLPAQLADWLQRR